MKNNEMRLEDQNTFKTNTICSKTSFKCQKHNTLAVKVATVYCDIYP